MTKKRRPIRRRKRVRRADVRKMEILLDDIEASLRAGQYEETIELSQALLLIAPPRSQQRAEALLYMANALLMRKRFDESYDALALAAKIAPNDSYVWYDFGLSALYTSRSGEAVLHLRRAVELEGADSRAQMFAEKLAFVENIARQEQQLRGDDFTLEQLIDQQALYKEAFAFFEDGEWQDAIDSFRQVIEINDCLPQPWGNLGTCLLMQRRYDEAEAAFSRALEMDPNYELARSNLENVGRLRAVGEVPTVKITSPFEKMNINVSVDFEE